MNKLLLSTVLLFACSFPILSQNLPAEWRITPDNKMLILGDQNNTGLYDQTQVKDIYLNFSQANYWTLLQNNYSSHTDLPATMVVDGITYDSVGVRFKGQTSYMSVPGLKKSFNISLDYVHAQQDLMGYKTLNLNNCFQDESFIREVFFQHQIKKHIPAAKSAYVRLFLNGASWGLYPNVQQLNKDYLEEWFLSNDGTNWRADKPNGLPGSPGWGDGTAALNYKGPDSTDYNTYYTLKSTNKTDPWSDLITTCDSLNHPSLVNLPSSLPAVLDIDRTLWFLASENLFADDDSYIYKGKMDYYVYWEPETGRLVPQEYDGNSVMDPAHASWGAFYNETNVNYPLMNRLFAVPEYRQRYIAHLNTLISELFDTTSAFSIIDGYKAFIDTMVQNDTKKLYTYTQFQNEVTVLKNFIRTRRNNLLNNSEVSQPRPVLSDVTYFSNGNAWVPPGDLQSTVIRAKASFVSGVYAMNLYYSNALVGNFTKLEMVDDGLHDDLLAGDSIYGATIPGQAAGSWVRFYVESVANNPAKSVTYDPAGAEHNVYIYLVTPQVSSNTGVVINELMASNTATMADSAGEYDDWIELYNNTTQPADISGFSLTDNPANLSKWNFPAGTVIPAGGYLILWADEDSSQGAYHTNFKLSASSEQLMLLDTLLQIVDSVSWDLQTTDMGYARVPNGTGNFVIQQPTFSVNNNTVGIAEILKNQNRLFVYPNPAKDRLVIQQLHPEEDGIHVFNSTGQRIHYMANATGKTEIDISSLADGIYFVRAGQLSKSFMVQH